MAEGGEVIPVYILDDAAAGVWRPGGAARWWLHGSLASLQAGLGGLGLRLRLLAGDSAEQIDWLVAETNAAGVFWNRRYEPWAIAQDKTIKAGLERRGIRARSFNGSLGREPWEVQRAGGEPYRVFTPFWRAWVEHGALPAPLPAPGPVGERVEPDHEALAGLGLLPTAPDWAAGLRETWQPGEAAAWAELDGFVDGRIGGYKAARDFPASPACRGCRRGCITASCRRGRSGTAPRWRWVPVPRRSCASWSGASSPITCCSTSRSCPIRRCGRSSPASPSWSQLSRLGLLPCWRNRPPA